MLQKIRDRISGWIAALFLGAIAVVFIFWGIRFENSATSAAARVNGESVSLEQVRRAWQQRQTELQRDSRDELPAELVRSEQRSLLMISYVASCCARGRTSSATASATRSSSRR